MPDFDFDEVIDRREVPALKFHQTVLGSDGADLFAAGVADMDFRVAPCITAAIERRLKHGLFGYEAVPDRLVPALIGWMERRHKWKIEPHHILHAPNVLNTLAMAVNCFTAPGDGIIIQPPVFFDFADIITENERCVAENTLVFQQGRYSMDFAGLEHLASQPVNRMLFLCNPHNPVGRVWTREELRQVDDICFKHDVFVVSDEIHCDITFPGHEFTPFASISQRAGANSITCLSPAKSFNIASCCSSFSVVPDDGRRNTLQAHNSRLTVNKNNAFASVAMEAAYTSGEPWLESMLDYLWANVDLTRKCLKDIQGVDLIEPDGTFLLWLDFEGLGLAPEELDTFLRNQAGWSITRGESFGHLSSRFGRLNIACPRSRLRTALNQLKRAVAAA
ncbi:putative C-S lyase [Ruegeria sp. HKCCD4884]|uniref:MalY/PatB family protein n=1 Tax=Ruegeria sp. HKCCD4884 TaxID=2683022 RepID=UPI00149172BB|nr:PatB family C-S lyase [Ruegeria sp. HKCCD4884]NOD95354.1 putative C-S lyase [Ruegeria sp. HKCCD4884]